MDQPGVLTIIRVENNYTVTLDLPIKGTAAPGGTVWVTDEDRHDLIQAIDAATEAINRPSAIELPFRGDPTQLAEIPEVRSLRNLGQLVYGLFLPTAVQEELRRLRAPLILSTNDPAIPWELLHDGREFLALRQPLARRLVGRPVRPAAPPPPSEAPAFLFIANPMEDLPESKAEALYLIEALTQRGVNCELLQGSRATYINVQDALRSGRYAVIHYTGHAFFDPQQPDRSGLRLAGGRVLPANQIERLLQGRPLIFLNACSSGREGVQRLQDRLPATYIGSHAEGLASAFILGGALAFIGTLWPVFDEGSRQFALHFYQQLLEGQSVGEALRHTRNTLRAQRPSDVTWASFILYGDPLLHLPLTEEPARAPSVEPLEEVSEVATLYERAVSAFDQERWEEAIRLFNQVLALAGPYRDTVNRLAEANRRAHRGTPGSGAGGFRPGALRRDPGPLRRYPGPGTGGANGPHPPAPRPGSPGRLRRLHPGARCLGSRTLERGRGAAGAGRRPSAGLQGRPAELTSYDTVERSARTEGKTL